MAGRPVQWYSDHVDRLQLGRIGELAAVAHLEALGYRILERNFRCPLGEIDVIAADRGITVFVEVKTRRTAAFGPPFEAITRRKQRRLARLAAAYLQGRGGLEAPARFDAVAVAVGPNGRVEAVELLVDAFAAG
ncbi:MAG TPA: YraN family protein [bacterium]|nr:YraN family protein [bacterium]